MGKISKIVKASISAMILYSFIMPTSVLAPAGDFEEDLIPVYLQLRRERSQNMASEESGRERLLSVSTRESVLKFKERATCFVKGKIGDLFSRLEQRKQQFMQNRAFPWPTMGGFTGFPIRRHLMSVALAEGQEEVTSDGQSTGVENEGNPRGSSTATETLDQLQLGIREVEQRLTRQQVGEQVTILIGNTGAGKSTIFNQLQGVPLVAKEHEGRLVIERVDESGTEHGRIVHGFRAGTTFPYISRGLFDCPGFQDTRGPAQDIINGYSLHKLFGRVQNFRLVLVVSEGELEANRGQAFVTLIKQLEEVFPGKAAHIKQGLNLIVTKGESGRDNEANFRKTISGILKSRKGQKGFTEFEREMLEFFASQNNNQITFFNKPRAPGELHVKHPLVRGDTYVNIKGLSPKITISAESKLFAKDIADMFTEDTSQFLTAFQSGLKVHTRQFVRSHEGPARRLRDSFRSISDDLAAVSASPQAFEENVERVERVLARFDPQLSSRFNTLMGRRKFLINIKPESLSINLDLDVNGRLTAVSKDLKPLSEVPTADLNAGSLVVRGHIVGTSDIHRRVPGISRLTVYGLNSLLVDQNVIAPGVSVAFASPFWRVVGKRQINLRGKDGNDIVPFQAKFGVNGRPGMPGQSGGHFYGFVDEVHNESILTINLSGGKGGKGQDGGDGIDGIDGIDGREEDVTSREPKCIAVKEYPVKRSSLVKYVRWAVVPNDESRLTYRSGSLGKPGGDAGAGGEGGCGGEAGIFALEGFKDTSPKTHQIKVVAKKGQKGSDGVPGKAGKGGMNGKIYQGVYLEKSFNGWGCLKKIGANGTGWAVGGAIIGGLIGIPGGPPGIAAGAKIGAAIGGGAGTAAPLAGSGVDQLIGGWEQSPHMQAFVERAPDGSVPKIVNKLGIEKPQEAPDVNANEIRLNLKKLR